MTEDVVHVPVKAKHIRNGRCTQPSCCAVALAIADAFEDVERVSVAVTNATVRQFPATADGFTRTYWDLDEYTSQFIRCFDSVKRKDRKEHPQLQPFTAVLTRKR